MEDQQIESESIQPGITVKYTSSCPTQHPGVFAHALKAEVILANDYPTEIFVFQRSTTGTDGTVIDQFIQVASPVDIEETPTKAPDLQNGMPYYREKEVTLWFRNLDDLRLAKSKLKEEIQAFVRSYDNVTKDLNTEEIERYER